MDKIKFIEDDGEVVEFFVEELLTEYIKNKSWER